MFKIIAVVLMIIEFICVLKYKTMYETIEKGFIEVVKIHYNPQSTEECENICEELVKRIHGTK